MKTQYKYLVEGHIIIRSKKALKSLFERYGHITTAKDVSGVDMRKYKGDCALPLHCATIRREAIV